MLDLVEQLADVVRLGRREGRADGPGLAIGPQRDDVADLAALDAVEQLLAGLAVPAHQADADLQVLLDRLLGQRQHLPRGRAVDGDRLLHEDVQALLDRVGEVDPAEGRRRGEDDDVAGLQAVHRLLVAVEADELLVFLDQQLVAAAELLVELVVAVLELGVEDVGHGDELDRAARGVQGVGGGAGAAAAAADQGDLDRVALAGVDEGHRGLREGRGGRDDAAGLEEVTTRGGGLGVGHGLTPAQVGGIGGTREVPAGKPLTRASASGVESFRRPIRRVRGHDIPEPTQR